MPLSCISRRGRGRFGTMAAAWHRQLSLHLVSFQSWFDYGWWRAQDNRRTRGSTLARRHGRWVPSGWSLAKSGNLDLESPTVFHATEPSPLDKELPYWGSVERSLGWNNDCHSEISPTMFRNYPSHHISSWTQLISLQIQAAACFFISLWTLLVLPSNCAVQWYQAPPSRQSQQRSKERLGTKINRGRNDH